MTRHRFGLLNSVALLTLAALYASTFFAVRSYMLERSIDQLLFARAEAAPAALNLDSFGDRPVYVQLASANGDVLASSTNLDTRRLPIAIEQRQRALAGQGSYLTSSLDGQRLRLYVTAENRTLIVTAAALDDDTSPTLLAFALSGIIGMLVALGVGWYLARLALQPIEVLATTVRAVSTTDDLARRVPPQLVARHDAVGSLAGDVNGMLARLQTAARQLHATLDAQRRFVADASHELRTPLTTIRGNVQLLTRWFGEQTAEPLGDLPLESVFDDLSLETERMARLVDGLLTLARADAEQHLELRPVPLTPILEAAFRAARFLADDVELTAEDLAPDVWVAADVDRLEQAVLILLDNAVRYTPAGGRITLTAVPLAFDGRDGVAIEVTDSGRGVAVDEQARIFERFYRAEATRDDAPGTGLGLAVARWIVAEHHGAIDVRSAQPHGSTFTIWLPQALAASEEDLAPDRL